MEDNKKVRVINRAGNGIVSYSIPDMGNLQRTFQDGEEKILTYEEMRKLSYIPGGQVLLDEYLIIDDKEVLDELNMSPEPEYYYTKDDVLRLMQEGSLDEFLDCLDFAPEGVKESIKTLAVDLPLNDVAKRKAINDKLNFNVDKAIEIKEISEAEEAPRPAVQPLGRRAATAKSGNAGAQQKEGAPKRRVVVKTDGK